MVEIALSLAIIGFALVAIIGILPIGMGMQKENREDTIINQDASVFLEAIRSGNQGLNDLTNYVMSITNTVMLYRLNGTLSGGPITYGYTTTNAPYPLINGYRIIGLLSTPKFVPTYTKNGAVDGYASNHVVAYVRSISGPVSEKFPQGDATVQDLGLSYRLMPEIVSYGTLFNPSYGNLQPTSLQSNLTELRLTFRWPLVDPKGRVGPSQQSFRCEVGGFLQRTNEMGFLDDGLHTVYFFQPRTYLKGL
jgi:hypothetical protein